MKFNPLKLTLLIPLLFLTACGNEPTLDLSDATAQQSTARQLMAAIDEEDREALQLALQDLLQSSIFATGADYELDGMTGPEILVYWANTRIEQDRDSLAKTRKTLQDWEELKAEEIERGTWDEVQSSIQMSIDRTTERFEDLTQRIDTYERILAKYAE